MANRTTMRVRVLLVTIGLLVLTAPPISAADQLTVKARAAQMSVDISVTRSSDLTRWSLSGGDVRAFALVRLSGGRALSTLSAAGIDVASWRTARVVMPLPHVHLSAGRYRLFLLGDAPVTVRLGLGARAVSAARVGRFAVIRRSTDTYARAVPPFTVESHAPVTVARSVVLTATRFALRALPAGSRSLSVFVQPGAGDCAASTAPAARPLPAVETSEALVALLALTPAFSGPGCAVTTYQGTDQPARADTITITVQV